MPRDHTRVNLDIWGDDDFRDLPVDAQNLYWLLWTSPDRTYCGGHWWHPGKLTQFASDWTVPRIEGAGAVLSERLFLIIDEPVEECLLRSWIKHDGLWRTPNMAVSMANARAAMTSKSCRGVVVHEVKKLASRHPGSSSWDRIEVANLLSQKAVDPSDLVPFTPRPTPPSTPPPTPGVTPPLTLNPNPPVNPPSNPPSTTATTTTTATKGGYVSRERHLAVAPPPPSHPNRCEEHTHDPNPPNCPRCADIRKADEALQRSLREARQRMARDFWIEVRGCDDCDNKGFTLDPDTKQSADEPDRCPNHDWAQLQEVS